MCLRVWRCAWSPPSSAPSYPSVETATAIVVCGAPLGACVLTPLIFKMMLMCPPGGGVQKG